MGGVCCAPGAEDAANNDIGGAGSPARPGVSNADNTMSKSQAPSTPPQTPTSQAAPAPKAKAQAKASPGGGGGGSSEGLSFELVLSDLEQAELLAYGTAFSSFGAQEGSVPLDCAPLKEFLQTNSNCPYDQIEEVLLNFAMKYEPELKITQTDFMDILRQHATSDTEVLNRFMGLNGGEPVSCEDCRSALLMMKLDMGAQATSVREERWETIFDSVMRNAEATVSMEAFRDYSFKVARIANVVHLAKV